MRNSFPLFHPIVHLTFSLSLRNLIDRILKANACDLRRVSRLYVTPLFSGNDTRTVIVAHPSKVKSIQAAFQG